MFNRFLKRLVSRFLYEFSNKGMTWKEVAAKADICDRTLWRLLEGETKEPRLSTVFKIAKAANMELELQTVVLKMRRKVS